MSEFTQFAEGLLEFNMEDLSLRMVNTGALVRIDGKGWITVQDAIEIRDWLNALIPRAADEVSDER
jgi:hypothetical protein